MTEHLRSQKNCIDFALWLYNRQTHQEKKEGSTKEDNGIGFNQPDALKLTPMLSSLNAGIEFQQKDLIMFVEVHLRPRLLKYKKQFKQYETRTNPIKTSLFD